MSGRVRLGDWTCPSGNNVAVFYRPVDECFAALDLEWDSPPPLSADDERFYLHTVRAAIASRVQEYTERTGQVLWLMP